MASAPPAKAAGAAVEYHQVGAPDVVRRTCASRCRTAGSACLSPRAVVLAVVVAVVTAWAEARTRVGIYAVKFLVSRAEAWWLGNPKCPPRDVRHRAYHYPDRPTWAGDDAFWAHLPCGRSSYRVIVPPALLAAGSVSALGDAPGGDAGDDACDNATIVTAFFDLGRSGWGGAYARKLDDYFADSKRVMFTLRNPQVWFTQDEFVDIILSERARHGLENRTVVIAMDHDCVPTAGLYNATAEALCAPGFLDFFWETWAPEQLYPWYSVLMWAKAHFAAAATELSLLTAPYYIWLDAGCHYPVCRPADHAHTCLRPWGGTNTSRLRMAAPEPVTPAIQAMSDWEFDKLRRNIISGTIFGGGPDAVRRGKAAFMGKVYQLLDAGIPDMDQPVWGMLLKAETAAARRTGDASGLLLEPYYTAYEWLTVLDFFSSPPAGDMSPFRAVEGRWKPPR